MGGNQNAVKRKALKLNQHIAKATRSLVCDSWKVRIFYLFGVSSCKAAPLHAIHCLHSGGTCRHRHLSSSENSFEDTMPPKKPFRSKTNVSMSLMVKMSTDCMYVEHGVSNLKNIEKSQKSKDQRIDICQNIEYGRPSGQRNSAAVKVQPCVQLQGTFKTLSPTAPTQHVA